MNRLPSPPSGLRIVRPVTQEAKKAKTSFSSIAVKWNYEYLGFPCNFTVQFRQKGTLDPWVSCKTTRPGQIQLSIDCPTGSQMEIRIAADTFIGRSDYSAVIETSVSDADSSQTKENNRVVVRPPTYLLAKLINETTVELKWKPPSRDHRRLCYRINCWKTEGESFSACEHVTEWTRCCLGNLDPETTYSVNIVTSSNSEWTDSPPSKTIQFKTGKNIRIVERIVGRTEKISVENGLKLYQVPLTKMAGRCKTAKRFGLKANGEIGKSMGNLHFTILLVGSSGCGKESLINNFINYIFNVDLSDPFRFQLIDPSREENGVRVYDIHHSKGFRVNYSLTIIDTPNFYEEDPAKNKEISKTIEQFLKDKNGIKKVNLVGLVLDSSASYLEPINLYIYCFLISLFGEDIKTNVNFLSASAENENEWLWEELAEAELVKQGQNCHKFDSWLNSCYGKNFENFFCSLPQNAKSIVFSKRMADEKKRLEETVKILLDRFRMGVFNLKRLKKTKKFIAGNSMGVKFQFDVNVVQKVALPFGELVTNCTECKMTCHPNCGLTDNLFDCDVMDHSMEENIRTCRVCPKKCLWNAHAIESFVWDIEEERQTVSLNTMKRKYETDWGMNNLTTQDFEEQLALDLEATKQEIVELIQTVLIFVEQVNAIAQFLYPDSETQCSDLIDSIISNIDNIILWEEKVGIQERNVNLIKTMKDLSQLANSIINVPETESSSESEY